MGLVWFCGEGGLEEDLEGFYGIQYVVILEFGLRVLSWKCVCVTLKEGRVASSSFYLFVCCIFIFQCLVSNPFSMTLVSL